MKWKKILIIYNLTRELKLTENGENIRKRLEIEWELIYKKLNRKQARKKRKTHKVQASDETYSCRLNIQTTLPFPKISTSIDYYKRNLEVFGILLIILWDTSTLWMK